MKIILNDSKRIIVAMYYALVICIVPLFLENGYLNVTKAKADIYCAGTLFLLTIIILLQIWMKKRRDDSEIHLQQTEILLMMFVLNALVSSVLSGNMVASFFGQNGWRVGLYTLGVSVFFLLISVRANVPEHVLTYMMCLSSSIIFSLAIIDSAGVDVFGLHKNIIASQRYTYIATIGNIDWLAGYLCLMIPYFVWKYFTDETDETINIRNMVMILGIACIPLCNCESTYLGLGVAALFVLKDIIMDTAKMKKAAVLIILFSIELAVICYLPCFSAKRKTMEGITGILMKPEVICLLMTTGLFLTVFLKRHEPKERTKTTVFYAFVLLITFAVIMLLWNAVIEWKADYFHWGSGRGAIWKESLRIYFEEYSFVQKMFGVGPDMLREWYKGLSEDYGMTVLVSHSEPLQILLTMGIAGEIIYVLLVINVFRGNKYKKRNNEISLFFLPVVAYFGQSLINSANTTNLVIFTLFFGLYEKAMLCKEQ